MKKLILGLLLIFSFSYGEENLHLIKNEEVVTLTTLYAKETYNLSPSYTKEIIREVLAYYEDIYGSKSLANVSVCLALTHIKFHSSVEQCRIKVDLIAFYDFIEGFSTDDFYDSIRVTTSFGVAWLEMVAREKNNEKKNKKRI